MGDTTNTLRLAGSEMDVRRMGQGPELLFLHGHLGFWKLEPFFQQLAKSFSLIIPAHPGFEASPVDQKLNSVDDLGYLYLDLLDTLKLDDLPVIGSSFGAWIALNMAIKNASRISSLVLIDPVGSHFGGPEDPGVADIFSMGENEFATRGFADHRQGRKPYGEMSDQELLISSRNREAAARYAWMPPLYDPKLAQRLHRVTAPTLILWGEQDRITDRPYAEQMTAGIPNASLQVIADAGHFPVIEQPEETASRIAAFIR
nr:alpha/beta hydrolase [Sphingomonas sp. CDS-1]